jgi:hypothetical protein
LTSFRAYETLTGKVIPREVGRNRSSCQLELSWRVRRLRVDLTELTILPRVGGVEGTHVRSGQPSVERQSSPGVRDGPVESYVVDPELGFGNCHVACHSVDAGRYLLNSGQIRRVDARVCEMDDIGAVASNECIGVSTALISA